MNVSEAKNSWLAWLKRYGARKFLNSFLQNAHGAESTCVHCHQHIYLDLLEGGGVADWKTAEGDYGCEYSPDTCTDGTGSHEPRKL